MHPFFFSFTCAFFSRVGCWTLNPQCDRCSSATVCTRCLDGWYPDGQGCIRCPFSGCAKCDQTSPFTCLQCSPGFYSSGGVCTSVVFFISCAYFFQDAPREASVKHVQQLLLLHVPSVRQDITSAPEEHLAFVRVSEIIFFSLFFQLVVQKANTLLVALARLLPPLVARPAKVTHFFEYRR